VSDRIAIVGIGCTPLRPTSADVSFREMIFEAAVRAYEDAGITPDRVGTFVAISEDYREGTAIFDEYVPDQLGAVQKPVHTVTGDGLQGLAAAWMLLRTGVTDLAVLEGHSKASNVLYPAHIEAMALDPVFVRPHGWHPVFLAGLEMRAFMVATKTKDKDIAGVVATNRRNALRNPLAAYPAKISADAVLASSPVAEPLRELEIAAPADGAFVFVLARESAFKKLRGKPVFIEGVSWSSDTNNIFTRDPSRATYLEQAAQRVSLKKIDFAEVDDTYAYKQLQHLHALGLDGDSLPVNVSGGSLGCGHLHDASSLRGLYEAVLQLRGVAGERQISRAKRGVVASWRGLPTATGAVAVLTQ
jgi:acetyl-CoA C-acetyltransferase